MKVKALAKKLTEGQCKTVLGTHRIVSPNFDTEVGKIYTVLGITYALNSSYLNGTLLEISTNPTDLGPVPLALFEIVDPRPSIFWRAKIIDQDLLLWPLEFYQEFFHDDLSEGVPEVRQTFERVVDRLEHEFDEYPINTGS